MEYHCFTDEETQEELRVSQSQWECLLKEDSGSQVQLGQGSLLGSGTRYTTGPSKRWDLIPSVIGMPWRV